jgi:hypothetical protein
VLATVFTGGWFNGGLPIGTIIFVPVLLDTVFVLLGLPAILILSNDYDGVTNPYLSYVHFLDHEEQPIGIIPDLLEGEAQLFVSRIRQKKNGASK